MLRSVLLQALVLCFLVLAESTHDERSSVRDEELTSAYCGNGLVWVDAGNEVKYPPGEDDYPSNQRQCWFFHADENVRSVRISFSEFDTESGYDFVNVLSCPSDPTVLCATLAEYSGSIIPDTAGIWHPVPQGGYIGIQFTSDYGLQYGGFTVEFQPGSQSTSGAEAGRFDNLRTDRCRDGLDESVNVGNEVKYPPGEDDYPSNQRQCWFFDLDDNDNFVRISFSEFDTESGYDFVNVLSCPSDPTVLCATLAEYSGSIIPDTAGIWHPVPQGGYIGIQFTSDFTVQYGGFTAEFESSPTPPDTNNADRDCPSEQWASENILEEEIGELGFKPKYTETADCTWIIEPAPPTAPGDYFIKITFMELDTVEDYEWVVLFGRTGQDWEILQEFTGTDLPDAITLPEAYTSVKVVFNSVLSAYGVDAEDNPGSKGFNLTYEFTTREPSEQQCVQSLTLYHNESDAIDYRPEGGYPRNQDCSWYITPEENAEELTLTFENFKLFQGDFVTILDCTRDSTCDNAESEFRRALGFQDTSYSDPSPFSRTKTGIAASADASLYHGVLRELGDTSIDSHAAASRLAPPLRRHHYAGTAKSTRLSKSSKHPEGQNSLDHRDTAVLASRVRGTRNQGGDTSLDPRALHADMPILDETSIYLHAHGVAPSPTLQDKRRLNELHTAHRTNHMSNENGLALDKNRLNDNVDTVASLEPNNHGVSVRILSDAPIDSHAGAPSPAKSKSVRANASKLKEAKKLQLHPKSSAHKTNQKGLRDTTTLASLDHSATRRNRPNADTSLRHAGHRDRVLGDTSINPHAGAPSPVQKLRDATVQHGKKSQLHHHDSDETIKLALQFKSSGSHPTDSPQKGLGGTTTLASLDHSATRRNRPNADTSLRHAGHRDRVLGDTSINPHAGAPSSAKSNSVQATTTKSKNLQFKSSGSNQKTAQKTVGSDEKATLASMDPGAKRNLLSGNMSLETSADDNSTLLSSDRDTKVRRSWSNEGSNPSTDSEKKTRAYCDGTRFSCWWDEICLGSECLLCSDYLGTDVCATNGYVLTECGYGEGSCGAASTTCDGSYGSCGWDELCLSEACLRCDDYLGTDVCATDGYVLDTCGYGTGSCGPAPCDGSYGSCGSDEICLSEACLPCNDHLGTDLCTTDGYVLTVCGYGTGSCGAPCDGSWGSCGWDELCLSSSCEWCSDYLGTDVCTTDGYVLDTCGYGEGSCGPAPCDGSWGSCGLDELCLSEACEACDDYLGTGVCTTDGYVLDTCGYGTGSCGPAPCDGSYGSCGSDEICLSEVCEACDDHLGTGVCATDGYVLGTCGHGTGSCGAPAATCDGSYGSCGSDEICLSSECGACSIYLGTDVCATDGYVLDTCGNGEGSCAPRPCDGSYGSCGSDELCLSNECRACSDYLETETDLCATEAPGYVLKVCGDGTGSCGPRSCDGASGSCGSDELCLSSECRACDDFLGTDVCATDGYVLETCGYGTGSCGLPTSTCEYFVGACASDEICLSSSCQRCAFYLGTDVCSTDGYVLDTCGDGVGTCAPRACDGAYGSCGGNEFCLSSECTPCADYLGTNVAVCDTDGDVLDECGDGQSSCSPLVTGCEYGDGTCGSEEICLSNECRDCEDFLGIDVCSTEGYVLTVCGDGVGTCGPLQSCDGSSGSCGSDEICLSNECRACRDYLWTDLCTTDGYVLTVCGDGVGSCTSESVSCEMGLRCETVLENRLTGQDLPAPVVSMSGIMKVHFLSDSTDNDGSEGFRASYAERYLPDCGNITYTNAEQTAGFIDFRPPPPREEYANDQVCRWLINPPASTTTLSLWFLEFDTEACCDKVRLFQCTALLDSNSNDCLDRVELWSHGGSVPDPGSEESKIRLRAARMEVMFESDSSLAKKGFRLEFDSEQALAQDGEAQSGEAAIRMQFEVPIASEIFFENQFLDNFRQNLADAAGVPVDDVKVKLLEVRRRRKLVSAESQIQVEIIVADGDAASELQDNLEESVRSALPVPITVLMPATTIQVNRCPSNAVLDEQVGEIDFWFSGGYPKDSSCAWVIAPSGLSESGSVTLKFSQMGTVNNYDFVTIFACNDGIACQDQRLVAQVSGTIIPEPLSSDSYDTDIFKLEFTSDENSEPSSEFRGFVATYETIGGRASNCPDRKVEVGGTVDFWNTHTSNELLEHPQYLNNADCSWILQLQPPDEVLEVRFPEFATEALYDFVRISECRDAACRIVDVLNGKEFVTPLDGPRSFSSSDWIQFTSSTLLLEFNSDSANTDRGFQVDFRKCNEEECKLESTGQSLCPQDSKLRESTAEDPGRIDFDFSNKNTQKYGPLMECSWIIAPNDGSNIIELDFSSFETEPQNDYITIQVCEDEACDKNTRLISSFSGRGSSDTTPSGPLMFTATVIKIIFLSDDSTQDRGFSAEWKGMLMKDISIESCQALSFRSGSTGSVEYRPSSGYPDDTTCMWIISPPGAEALKMTITEMNTEQSFDTLTFRECNDIMAGCTLVETLSGSQSGIEVFSLKGTMEITFTSDARNNPGASSGFRFQWQTALKSIAEGQANSNVDGCPTDAGASDCPGMNCCREKDTACVDGSCKECPVGLVCLRGQFIRGRYQGESWLLDRDSMEYYPEECPAGFQKYRPTDADSGTWNWRDAQCKPCGVGRYIVSESLGEGRESECQPCPVGSVCDCQEDIINAGVQICTLNKHMVKLDGEVVEHLGSWELDKNTGIYDLVSCPGGTEIAKMFTVTANGKTELSYLPQRQECRPCKDGEQYVLSPNKYLAIDGNTSVLKYHTCQDCPVGANCRDGFFSSGRTPGSVWKADVDKGMIVLIGCPSGYQRVREGYALGSPTTTGFDDKNQECKRCAPGLEYIIDPNGGACKGCPVGGSCDGSTMIPRLTASVWNQEPDKDRVKIYVLVSCPPGTQLKRLGASGRFDSEIQECHPCASGTEYIIEPNRGTCQPCPDGATCLNGLFERTVDASVWRRSSRGLSSTNLDMYELLSCPPGHMLVNQSKTGTFDAERQQCSRCEIGLHYIVEPNKGYKDGDTCDTCPDGATCSRTRGLLEPAREGEEWDIISQDERKIYKLVKCNPGHMLVNTQGGEFNHDRQQCKPCNRNEYIINENKGYAVDAVCNKCPRGADCECILADEDAACSPRADIVPRVVSATWELNADGRYELKNCPGGHQLNNKDANQEFSFSAQECQECPEGKQCTAAICNEECSDCEVGKYKEVKGAGACIECPRDTYNPARGSKAIAECRDCPPNSQTIGKGASDYTACSCSPGYYPAVAAGTNSTGSDDVKLVCEGCPLGGDCIIQRGKFSPRIEGSRFEAANENGYMRVMSCPQGYVMVKSLVEGQHQQDDCFFCPVNTYLLDEGVTVAQAANAQAACRPCPNGANCFGGTEIVSKPGFWRNLDMEEAGVEISRRETGPSDVEALVFSCPPNNCEGANNTCRDGHEGPVCGICKPNYVRAGGGSCVNCGQPSNAKDVRVVLALVGICLIGVALWYSFAGGALFNPIVVPRLKQNRVIHSIFRLFAGGSPDLFVKAAGIFKIIITALQISTSFLNTFRVKWPDSFTLLMGSLWFTKLDFLELPGPACISEPYSYTNLLVIKTIGPVILAVILAFPWIFVTLRGWGKPNKNDFSDSLRLTVHDPDDYLWKLQVAKYKRDPVTDDSVDDPVTDDWPGVDDGGPASEALKKKRKEQALKKKRKEHLVEMGWTWFQADSDPAANSEAATGDQNATLPAESEGEIVVRLRREIAEKLNKKCPVTCPSLDADGDIKRYSAEDDSTSGGYCDPEWTYYQPGAKENTKKFMKKILKDAEKLEGRGEPYFRVHQAVIDAFWNAVVLLFFVVFPQVSVQAISAFNCKWIGDPTGKKLLAADWREPCPLDDKGGFIFIWSALFTFLYPFGLPIGLFLLLEYFNIPSISTDLMNSFRLKHLLDSCGFADDTSGEIRMEQCFFQNLITCLGKTPDKRKDEKSRDVEGLNDKTTNKHKTTYRATLIKMDHKALEGETKVLLDVTKLKKLQKLCKKRFVDKTVEDKVKEKEDQDKLKNEKETKETQTRWSKFKSLFRKKTETTLLEEAIENLYTCRDKECKEKRSKECTNEICRQKRRVTNEECDEKKHYTACIQDCQEHKTACNHDDLIDLAKMLIDEEKIGLPALGWKDDNKFRFDSDETHEPRPFFEDLKAKFNVLLGKTDIEFFSNRDFQYAKTHAIARAGFLFRTYEVKFWYFELIEMLRKLLMTSVMVFLYPGTPSQLAFALVFSLVFLVVFMGSQPYLDPELDLLQTSTLVAQHCTLLYGVMAIMQENLENTGSSTEAKFVGWVVTLLNVLCIIVPVVKYAIQPEKQIAMIMKVLGCGKESSESISLDQQGDRVAQQTTPPEQVKRDSDNAAENRPGDAAGVFTDPPAQAALVLQTQPAPAQLDLPGFSGSGNEAAAAEAVLPQPEDDDVPPAAQPAQPLQLHSEAIDTGSVSMDMQLPRSEVSVAVEPPRPEDTRSDSTNDSVPPTVQPVQPIQLPVDSRPEAIDTALVSLVSESTRMDMQAPNPEASVAVEPPRPENTRPGWFKDAVPSEAQPARVPPSSFQL